MKSYSVTLTVRYLVGKASEMRDEKVQNADDELTYCAAQLTFAVLIKEKKKKRREAT